MEPRIILLTLLIKLAAAAAIAAAWLRSRDFKRWLFEGPPSLLSRIYMVILLSIPYMLGVVVRQSVKNFYAADLSFEASLLMGVLSGPIAGGLGGGLVSIPAAMNHEYLTLPFNVGVGVLAGILRDLARDPEEIWSFSPFIDLSVYRWVRKMIRRPHLDWQMGFFFLIVSLLFARMEIGKHFAGQIFYLQLPQGISPQATFGLLAAIYATTIAVVAIPLKIFNAARLELKLREHERLLLQARVENSIKHGLEPKLEGGKILLRSRITQDRLILYIADDGIGMDTDQPTGTSPSSSTGIGMSNVAERLKVLYGDVAEMSITSEYGIGTLITLELPLIDDVAASELTPQPIQAPGSLYP